MAQPGCGEPDTGAGMALLAGMLQIFGIDGRAGVFMTPDIVNTVAVKTSRFIAGDIRLELPEDIDRAPVEVIEISFKDLGGQPVFFH